MSGVVAGKSQPSPFERSQAIRLVGVSRSNAFAGSAVKLSSGTGGSCRLKAFPVLKYSARDSALDFGADARCAGKSAMDCGNGSLDIGFSSCSVACHDNARAVRSQTISSYGYRSGVLVGSVLEPVLCAARGGAGGGRFAVDPGGEQRLERARGGTPHKLSRLALPGL